MADLVGRQPALAAADLAACRAALCNGSRSFLAASRLLPADVRDSATALYAFCRMADDLIDEAEDRSGPGIGGVVEQLRERVERAAVGRPQNVVEDRALAAVMARHAIPVALPAALIEGFEWDALGRRYRTLDELEAYAARVAGSVGAMMALVMDVRSPSALARACDLGVAMQYTNIARDVGADARLGRLYLPEAWLRDAGVDPERWLAEPCFSPALGSVVERLLADADVLYRRVDEGLLALPARCRPGINAARLLYREIGAAVRRRGLDSVNGRAVVGRVGKSTVLARALVGALLLSPVGADEARAATAPLAATCFLVNAVVPSKDAGPEHLRAVPWWRFGERLTSFLLLLERLERRDRDRMIAGRLTGPGVR